MFFHISRSLITILTRFHLFLALPYYSTSAPSLLSLSLSLSLSMDCDPEESSASSLSSSSSSSSRTNPNSSDPLLPKRKAGRKKFRETRHPVYRGVRQRNGNRWVCEVREPFKKSRIWVGTFPTPEIAARAHDVAALALRGHFASLNFADSAWLLPRAKSSSSKDIQIAALAATKGFNPSATSPPDVADSKKVPEGARRRKRKVLEASKMDAEKSEKFEDGSVTVFMDEEALFNIPGFIDSMAEGLLLTPPALCEGFSWDDASEALMDLSLWNDG